MKALFRVVAVLALIATIRGHVVEYSDQVLKDLQLIDAYAGETKAEVINPDIEIEFVEREEKEEDAVYLVPASTPDIANPGVCEGTLGIKLPDTGDVFCGIDVFGLEVDYFENDKQNLQLALLFQSNAKSETAKPLVLDVPIFIQPSEYAAANKQKEFEDWATNNKVGIVSPVGSQTLGDISDKKKTKLNFKWLSDLLSFGVSRSTNPLFLGNSEVPVDFFISRPIVMPKHMAQEFISVVDMLQPEDDLYLDMN